MTSPDRRLSGLTSGRAALELIAEAREPVASPAARAAARQVCA
jgi:hypothetical protein